jgi:hypothetical protein
LGQEQETGKNIPVAGGGQHARRKEEAFLLLENALPETEGWASLTAAMAKKRRAQLTSSSGALARRSISSQGIRPTTSSAKDFDVAGSGADVDAMIIETEELCIAAHQLRMRPKADAETYYIVWQALGRWLNSMLQNGKVREEWLERRGGEELRAQTARHRKNATQAQQEELMYPSLRAMVEGAKKLSLPLSQCIHFPRARSGTGSASIPHNVGLSPSASAVETPTRRQRVSTPDLK